MIDFHSHILPGMDDGSSSVEESLAMLGLYTDRISDLCLTPHFYAHRDRPEKFLEKRNVAFEKLSQATEHVSHPNFHLGAEVYYFDGMSRTKQIENFKIGDTHLLLVEMPFGEWSSKMIDELIELRAEYGLIPVMAHIDRYQYGTGARAKYFEKHLSRGGLVQINAEPCLSFFGRKKAVSLIENGTVHFIGSDAHNMKTRKPNLELALDLLNKKNADILPILENNMKTLFK